MFCSDPLCLVKHTSANTFTMMRLQYAHNSKLNGIFSRFLQTQKTIGFFFFKRGNHYFIRTFTNIVFC